MNRPATSRLALVFSIGVILLLSALALATGPVIRASDAPSTQALAPGHCDSGFGALSSTAPVVACTASESPFVLPAAKPVRQGFCKCGCGARCQTSADCGGSACVPYITCC